MAQKSKVFQRKGNPVARFGCLAFVGIFFVFGLLCSGLYGMGMLFTQPLWFVLAAFLATLTAVPYGLLLLWLDRNEEEPISLVVTSFLWGACVATIISGEVNSTFAQVMFDVTGDEGVAGLLTASFSAPVIEELTKGVAVMLLFFLFRREFDNVLDGVLYGALVGLGFAWFENITYYMSAAGEGGLEGMLQNAWARGVVSASGGSHAAYTALTGCAFGLVRVMRRGFARWLLVPFFWGLAMFAHFAWNTFVGIVVYAISPESEFGQYAIGLPIAVLVLQLPFTFVLLITVLVAWRHENRLIQGYLSQVPGDVVTPEELAELVPARKRVTRSFLRFFKRGPAQWWHHRRLDRKQIELAFLLWHHEQDGIAWKADEDADVLALSDQIRRIRPQIR